MNCNTTHYRANSSSVPGDPTIAIGGAAYGASENILRDADTAMYRAKAAGKGRCEMFDQSMHTAAVMRLALENDLRRAVDEGEFVLHYQPIVTLETGKISGFEALLRWQRPGFGLVQPNEFIAIAEETGLIVRIGLWVLREACRKIRAWRSAFPAFGHSTVSVNLSARQFDDAALVPQIERILAETGADPASLRLEITESVSMTDVGHTIEILQQLRALGIQFSLDDFGTGYSSLSHFHRLPFDVLKIDRAFISTIDREPESLHIARTIMNLARSLNLEVVAEGAERPEQTAQLLGLGCKYSQGFVFSKPLPEAEISDLLSQE